MKNKDKKILILFLIGMVITSIMILFAVQSIYSQTEEKANNTLNLLSVDHTIDLEYSNEPINFLYFIHDKRLELTCTAGKTLAGYIALHQSLCRTHQL